MWSVWEYSSMRHTNHELVEKFEYYNKQISFLCYLSGSMIGQTPKHRWPTDRPPARSWSEPSPVAAHAQRWLPRPRARRSCFWTRASSSIWRRHVRGRAPRAKWVWRPRRGRRPGALVPSSCRQPHTAPVQIRWRVLDIAAYRPYLDMVRCATPSDFIHLLTWIRSGLARRQSAFDIVPLHGRGTC